MPSHFGVLSKRMDFECRASGGKRRSEGMASPLVLIMGLSSSTVLPDGTAARGSTGARFGAVLAVRVREPMRGLNRLLQGCGSSSLVAAATAGARTRFAGRSDGGKMPVSNCMKGMNLLLGKQCLNCS